MFRDRSLTDEEVAADRAIREEVMEEFPPMPAPSLAQPSSFSGLLKNAIRQSQKSIDAIASEAGVSPVLISQFVAGMRDIRMTTADRLAHVLGLHVPIE